MSRTGIKGMDAISYTAARANLAGYWSRRIDDEHRIVYRPTSDSLLIAQLRHHY